MKKVLCDICGGEIRDNGPRIEGATLKLLLENDNGSLGESKIDVHQTCGRAAITKWVKLLQNEYENFGR